MHVDSPHIMTEVGDYLYLKLYFVISLYLKKWTLLGKFYFEL